MGTPLSSFNHGSVSSWADTAHTPVPGVEADGRVMEILLLSTQRGRDTTLTGRAHPRPLEAHVHIPRRRWSHVSMPSAWLFAVSPQHCPCPGGAQAARCPCLGREGGQSARGLSPLPLSWA